MALHEGALVRRVHDAFGAVVAPGALGFSDDTALLPPPPAGATRVVTTDLVLEEVDFAVGLGPLESAGHRALTQNTSDLCAMGARPAGFVWSLALPSRFLDDDAAYLDAFLAGAARAAREQGIALYGGDLSRTSGPMTCAVTAFGDVTGAPLLRSGARPGDVVYVSRPLGASQAGLELLLEGRRAQPDAFAPGAPGEMRARFDAWKHNLSPLAQAAVDAHLWPCPEVSLAPLLVGRATACMDISDGLLLDLSRLCAASGVGASLRALDDARHPAAGEGDEGRERMLSGGEEYALLFTLPKGASLDGLEVEGKRPIAIGTLREEPGLVEETPAGPRAIEPRGWQHFG